MTPERQALRELNRQLVPAEEPAEREASRRRIVGHLEQQLDGIALERPRRPKARTAVWGLLVAAVLLLGWLVPGLLRNEDSTLATAAGAHLLRNGERVGAARSQRLRSGDQLAAGAGSFLLDLPSGARVKASPGTELTLGELGPEGERLVLVEGLVDLVVPKLGAKRVLSVRTEHALVTVHGTRFVVELAGQGSARATRVSVMEGLVSVKWAGGVEYLGPGASWSSARGQPAPSLASSAVSPVPSASASAIDSAPSSSSSATAPPPIRATRPATPAGPNSRLAAANALYQRAIAARRRGEFSHALGLLDQFLARYPTTPLAASARVERFRLLQRLGKQEQAAREARRYLAEEPGGFAREEARDVAVEPLRKK